MTPLPAGRSLDQFFLDARCRLLDLAAMLDRIDRGESPDQAAGDPRLAKLREGIALLQTGHGDRAERVQRLFSLGYDPNWPRPSPRA